MSFFGRTNIQGYNYIYMGMYIYILYMLGVFGGYPNDHVQLTTFYITTKRKTHIIKNMHKSKVAAYGVQAEPHLSEVVSCLMIHNCLEPGECCKLGPNTKQYNYG